MYGAPRAVEQSLRERARAAPPLEPVRDRVRCWPRSSRRRSRRCEPSGPSVSAHSARADARAGLARDRLLDVGVAPSSPRTPPARARAGSSRPAPRSRPPRAGRGRARRDHGADHAQPVAARVGAERVVGGDELALRGAGSSPMQRATARSSRSQPRGVARGVGARSVAGARRVGLGQRVAQIAATARTAARGSCHQCGSSPRAVGASSVTTGASVPAPSIASLEPLVDLAARAHDEVGAASALTSPGADS